MLLQPTKFGLAFGIAGVVLYLGCMLLMTSLGQDGTGYANRHPDT